ncbi:helix-turn-helix transcriptional regulator [Nitrosomonas oligotropha]|uniref:helix-turn-helix transcriptional regulator n=1 Tax=Nitrosomonas oligotropha TaxID=42354 RepID=UPI00136DFEB2|nr:AlpA family phage regulatory protein [Nitrosomonas oligotropha]MXS82157.1 AlpA family phage regulatory protein [Nitrosomonas oligotropha]
MLEKNTNNILIRLPEVVRITGLRRSSIYSKINSKSKYFDASFPKPVPLSSGIRGGVAWPLLEIEQWISSRINARENRQN